MQDHKWASLLYNQCLKHHHWQQSEGLRGRLWRWAWSQGLHRFGDVAVSTNMHGRRTLVNFGHSYGLYARRFLQWNTPLIELAHQAFLARHRPIHLVDVGASVGDTVRLLQANCGDEIATYLCVEGDADFFSYLKSNLEDDEKVRLVQALLSDRADQIPSLVRTHPGTASAQGDQVQRAVPLDVVVEAERIEQLDVLKIDVDGFDGKVLMGSHRLLDRWKPAVIFEWDPYFCQKTENSWTRHFELLVEHGYDRFLWFTKYGNFSHPMTGYDAVAVELLAQLCLSGAHDFNWHYDVVALHRESPIDPHALSMARFAKQRRSWF
ncbi:MAG TPA: FkbM family methyltransferase [Pseudomonadales bacterium]|nr:FkbM family methyltransferase [Pseudomonadales bacterium]HMW84073.1 FkbM family methyltransferase [Pseudomonadales bacterium]HNC76842.1 FkbM family methyltransferase [Pseudomonadales bacterium]HNF74167.1 FkbM family methyltransferase [Pseudomonadales bacterium]